MVGEKVVRLRRILSESSSVWPEHSVWVRGVRRFESCLSDHFTGVSSSSPEELAVLGRVDLRSPESSMPRWISEIWRQATRLERVTLCGFESHPGYHSMGPVATRVWHYSCTVVNLGFNSLRLHQFRNIFMSIAMQQLLLLKSGCLTKSMR